MDARFKAASILFDITQVFGTLVKLQVYEEEDCRESVIDDGLVNKCCSMKRCPRSIDYATTSATLKRRRNHRGVAE